MVLPTLVAHRGYSSRYPENTLASIEAALTAGARYIEFDLQMIADDEFVLMHDNNLQRASGISKSVFSLTRQTIRNFQADYYGKFSGQFNGIKIPLLENVLSLLAQFPQAVALVEIKQESLDEHGVEKVMQKLLPQLKSIQDRCYLISFNTDAIDYTKKHSTIKTGFILHKFNDKHRQLSEQLQPELLICNYRKLPEFNSLGQLPENTLWPGDWDWVLYAIDQPELAIRYADSNIAYIETNAIGTMLQHPLLNAQVIDHSANDSP